MAEWDAGFAGVGLFLIVLASVPIGLAAGAAVLTLLSAPAKVPSSDDAGA